LDAPQCKFPRLSPDRRGVMTIAQLEGNISDVVTHVCMYPVLI